MKPPRDEPIPDPASFLDILRRRARDQPEASAFRFGGGEDGEVSLTFGGWDTRARALAARLQELGVDGRALLLFPPGIEFLNAFFGCLYAGVVAVPAYLPRINRPMTRLRAIVADCRPSAVLTTSALLPDAERWRAEVPELAGVHRLAADGVDDGLADSWRDPGVGRESLAFLQYTSGSTSAPKGVMVSHGNLLHNSALIRRAFGSTAESRGVFWLPLFHDMGLIGGALQTLYCGGSSTLLSPVAFLQRPIRWLEAISQTGATISGGPNFAYDLCVRKVTEAQKAGLDLSSWRVAFNGAEPIRPETLARFAEAFAPCGFRREAFLPCYGLAEATLFVSGGSPAAVATDPEAPDRVRVGSGPVAPELDVAIVDPESRTACAPGAVGEVWVRGGSVAQGYWGRDEATELTFRATLAGSGDGPFLRTGDLGFLDGGQLVVTGRLKDLIIVRGRNVYPQDVEWTVERSHPALRPESGAAFAVEADGEERLIVVHEVERGAKNQVEEVLQAIRRAIAEEHDLDVHTVCLIKAASIPKTSSGKIQRHACREEFLAGTLEIVGKEENQPQRHRDTETHEEEKQERSQRETIERWLIEKVAGAIGVEPGRIDTRTPFAGYGLGSAQAVGLAGDLQEWLGRTLSPTLVYEYPTIGALAGFLAGGEERAAEREGAATSEAIAIIGVGCRFPGADGPEAFWELLRDGVEAVGEVPGDRWRRADGAPGRGGFLERIDRFDADFFGISPREAMRTDPQQRMLLEVAWEALEDAGQAPERLAGSRTGVFVGISTNDYGRIQWGHAGAADAYIVTGNAASIAANRLSYLFDFRGPSLAIDTACSSSLVAVQLACRSLRDGEATLAIAGGVNALLSPEIAANFAEAGFLAPDGRCKTFDARADGYVRGEGAGLVVLKPLARALDDGDPILAVIRGGAVNQDGRSNGLTAPSRQAQEAVLRDAYRAAGVAPSSVAYVEAHGSGTLLGDPIEAKALGAVLGEGRDPGRACLIGSVKTNIGHLEAAAGVAGLIKAALALRHRVIPPSLHFEAPNPHIPFEDLRLDVPRAATAWPEGDGPTRAGVSAFGFGGTNAHLVLEEPPRREEAARGGEEGDAVLVPLSARSPEALRALAGRYRDALGAGLDAPLADVAYSSAVRRGHHDHRLAVVAGSREDLAAQLGAYLRGEAGASRASGVRGPGSRPRLVFVCPGQGARWLGAGRTLLAREPAFRAAILECDAHFQAIADWSLQAEFAVGETEGPIPRAEVVQPMMLALQVGLAALWRSWGIVPDAVVGHSLGEIAAAHLAGALSLDDAFRVAFHRSRLMAQAAGRGLTATVGLDPDEARRLVDEHPGRLAIAALNGPDTTTLSGDPETVRRVVEELEARGVFARQLDVDCAFHGPQMDPLLGPLARALADIRPRPTAIPFVSTVTGSVSDGQALDASYWVRNLRETVRFSDAIAAIDADGPAAFLELGPHPALGGSVARTLRDRGRTATILPTLRRGMDERAVPRRSLGTLYTLGYPVDWSAASPAGRFVKLPPYPWQRERFWLDDVADVRRNGHAPSRNGTTHAEPPAADVSDCLYGLAWRLKDRPEPPGTNGQAGPWLVLDDGRGTGHAVAECLEGRGATCTLVPFAPLDADGFRLLLAKRPYRGVVHLWGLADADASAGEGTLADLRAAEARGVGSLVPLAQALASPRDGARTPRLWLVTRGAQGEAPRLAAEGLAQAALWGLGRSLALESPGLWGGMIDLDPDGPADVAALVEEMASPDGEDQVAFRAGGRYVARLARRDDLAATAGDLPIRPDGTYLITGGLGDLGLRAARWLAGRGARRLVLVSRRPLPCRTIWDHLPDGDVARGRVEAIREIERLGATVLVATADAADPVAMAALFDRVRGTFPAVRGIIHAAGQVTPDATRDLDAATLDAVLRPKVAGTWVLHEQARGLPLDFLVLFSSVASVLGARESHYAAANAFLDAFAGAARAAGIPALSVNWGPWADAGMAASADRSRAFRLLGLAPLAPERAWHALECLVASGTASAMAADVDWATLKRLHGEARRGRLLDEIDAGDRAVPSSTSNGRWEWRDAPFERRREELVRYFRARVAGVLRLEPDRIDPARPLNTLGLDSLMAIELKGDVEAELGAALSLSSLMRGPTLAELADETLAKWDDPEAATATALAPMPADEAIADLPLSFGQRSLWYAHQLDPSSTVHTMAGAARVRAELDVTVLRRSLQRLVDRHEALRTTFAEVDGEPVQRVAEESEVWLRVEDAAAWGDEELGRRLADEAARPFDLGAGPLFRTHLFTRSPREHYLLLTLHHIVGDFWSFAVLMHELAAIVPAERIGGEPPLEPLSLRFADFARWQADRLDGPDGERLGAYWKDKLDGAPAALDLPADRPRPAVPSRKGAVRTLRLDPDLTGRLIATGADRGATLYVTLLAAFQALLGRLAGQDDIVVGSPAAGRDRKGLADVVGYFVNPLPLRADLSGDPTFADFLGRVKQSVHEALEHQDYPFTLMVDRLKPTREPGRTPLFQTMFVFQKAQRLDSDALTSFALREDGRPLDLGGFPLESIALEKRTSEFDLTLMAAQSEGGLSASLEYSTDLFDPATIDRMLGQFRTLLEGIADDPDRPVSVLPILTESEREVVVSSWNATDAAIPAVEAIHHLFEAQAARTPDAVAVAADGQSWSYRDLDARANRLAHHLRRLGVDTDVRVGLCVDRSIEMVVGILGILKAGGAYVPMDPDYPAERLAFLAEDARTPVLLTQRRLLATLPETSTKVVLLDAHWDEIARESDSAPSVAIAPESLAYVIYTSGSTGKPKGVEVSHRNLVHSTEARPLAYGPEIGRFLLLSSFAFDSSVAGIFWTLCHGGRLVLPPPVAQNDPIVLADLIEAEGTTHLLCVPTLLGLILAESPAAKLASLRVAIVAGEPCPGDLPGRLNAALPRVALFNEYGPTEATVWCSVHRCEADGARGPVPIGRPIANTRIYVLDRNLAPTPIGVAGELYVGGAGVARGYLDRPGLTASRFVPDPFADLPGARLYRTGDLARWRPDGLLEYLGRLDGQVKIRGHRVELGEVESALAGHPAVREAVAMAREDVPGDRRLVAYFVPVNGAIPPSSELRRWLRSRLPDAMVPATIVPLEAIPVGPNGKVARADLPAPAADRNGGDTPFEAPRDPVEEALARAAAGVLGVDRVGIHDNFFDLGVDSIQGLQIVARARRAGLVVTPAQLFEHQTIAALAPEVAPAGAAEEPAADAPDLTAIEKARAGGIDVEDAYPLSPAQEGMLFHSLDAPDSGVYVQQFTCLLRGDVDPEALAGSWRKAVARHPVLRTAFPWVDADRPLQVVSRSADVPMARHDWRWLDPVEQDGRFAEFLEADRRLGFATDRPPLLRLTLLRVADDAHRLVWTYHHLMMDGWCLPIVLREVLASYEAAREGRDLELPAPRPFRDYIAWLNRQDPAEADAYWAEALRGVHAATPLGIDRVDVDRPADDGPAFAERFATVPADTTAALQELARTHQLTLNTVVQGAYALLLGRYSGRRDVVYGVTVSGRPAALDGVEGMVGMFINTLPLRVPVAEEMQLLPWLADLQGRQVALRRHEWSPLVQVQGHSEVPRGRPLFESIFVFENYPVDASLPARAGRLGIEEVRFLETTNYPLTIMVFPGEELRLRAGFDTRRFDPGAIDRMLGHLRTALEGFAADPARRLADVPILSPAELGVLLGQGAGAIAGASGLDRLSDEEIDSLLDQYLIEGEARDE